MIAIRIVILVASLVALLFWLRWGSASRKRAAYAAGMIIFLFGLSSFHTVRLFNMPISATFLNNWSLGLHLYAAILTALIGIYLARHDKHR